MASLFLCVLKRVVEHMIDGLWEASDRRMSGFALVLVGEMIVAGSDCLEQNLWLEERKRFVDLPVEHMMGAAVLDYTS
jgi:hypothetical protein